MVARLITVFAPVCNEWPAPLPILLILGFSILGLVTSTTFPSDNEFVQGEKLQEVKFNLNEQINHKDDGSDITYHNLSDDMKDPKGGLELS